MSLIAFSIAAIVSATLVLAIVYATLYAQSRERYLAIWTTAWGIYSIGLGVFLAALTCGIPGWLTLTNPLAQTVTSLLLLLGTHVFLGLRLNRLWLLGPLLVLVWSVAAGFLSLPFFITHLPLGLFVAATLAYIGYLFHRFRGAGYGMNLVVWGYLALGVHQLGFPLLAADTRFAPWGYLVTTVLGFTVAIGMIVIHLQRKEQRFRLLAENARDCICRFHTEPAVQFDYVSPAVTSLTGYAPEDFYRDPQLMFTVVHPEDREILTARIERIPRDADTPVIVRFIRKDGTVVWTEHRMTLIRDEATGPVIETIIRDTTPLKELEDALRLINGQLKAVINSSPLAIVAFDRQGNIKSWNPAAEAILGWEEHEALNRPLPYVPLDKQDESEALKKRAFNGERCIVEVQRQRRDGTILDLSLSLAPLIDDDGAITGAVAVMADISERKRMEEALRKAEQEKALILDAMSEFVAYYDTDMRIVWANRMVMQSLGLPLSEIVNRYCYEVNYQRSEPCPDCPIKKALETGEPQAREMTYATGAIRLVSGYPVRDEDGNVTGVVDVTLDVTERRRAEDALRQSEAKYRELADSLPETVFEMDTDGKLTYANLNGFRKFGYTEEEFRAGIYAVDTILAADREKAMEGIKRAMEGNPIPGMEYTAITKDGRTFPIVIHSTPIVHEGKVSGLRGFLIDISEQKQAEEKLRYLSLCDPLTGLYNRTCFEQEMRRAKNRKGRVGLILCDVDGLKLVNDTLGHKRGDELLISTAGIIRGVFRDTDIVARVGGDEFAVLLFNTTDEVIQAACRRVETAVEEHNLANPGLPLSISLGYATADSSVNMGHVFKEADDKMYREKLHRRRSIRSSIVQTLMRALEARDFVTEHHAENLMSLVTSLGRAVGLSESDLSDLRLLAQFHDIGKVGIPDRILFKEGPLDAEERTEMKRHSEIGFRIAQSALDLAPIADWILKHHEWWNGQGYPLGLKEDDIPLQCRILAIADAYDAMTSDRPYRKAMTREEALAELRRWAGIQFDPHLTEVFVNLAIE